jgi:hypothetical protein
MTDYTGTTYDPRLIVVSSAGGGGSTTSAPKHTLLMLGAG